MSKASFEISGRIYAIGDTQQVTERFRKRTFVLELKQNPKYPQRVEFAVVADRCDELDDFEVGDRVDVEFGLRGRKWESPEGKTRYFNTLSAWALRKAGEKSTKSWDIPF